MNVLPIEIGFTFCVYVYQNTDTNNKNPAVYEGTENPENEEIAPVFWSNAKHEPVIRDEDLYNIALQVIELNELYDPEHESFDIIGWKLDREGEILNYDQCAGFALANGNLLVRYYVFFEDVFAGDSDSDSEGDSDDAESDEDAEEDAESADAESGEEDEEEDEDAEDADAESDEDDSDESSDSNDPDEISIQKVVVSDRPKRAERIRK